MELDSVSYIYTDDEIAAILELTNCTDIPELPLKSASAEAGIVSLEQAGLLLKTEKEILLGRVSMFLMKEIKNCLSYLCARENTAFRGMFCTPHLYITVNTSGGNRWRITPFPQYSRARRDFLDKSMQEASETRLILYNATGTWRCQLPPGRKTVSCIEQATSWMLFHDIPHGKDKELWKQ